MTETSSTAYASPRSEPADEPYTHDDAPGFDGSLREDMRKLAADARKFADAEVAYQKARAAYAGDASKSIAILGVSALTLLFFATMAAVVGLVIALAPVLSPWGAMAAVTVVLLVLAAICAKLAASKAKRMKAILSDGGGNGSRS